jgi:hypothetical protein
MATNANELAVPGSPGPHGGAPPSGQRNAYVGPQPFPPDRRLYGRDRELLALTNRLMSERLVLLYSPSGAGKTSLIQAKGGLRERMAGEGFHLVPVVRVGLFAGVAAKTGVNRYLLSTLAELTQAGTGPGGSSPEKLAEELRRDGDEQVLAKHLARLTPRAHGEDPAQPFLVFDQFEELLTLDPTDEEAKRHFLRTLGAVLRDRDRWALFAMREDYVPSLDPYLPLLPDRLSATFRLDLLGTRAAATAIREPAGELGVTIEESVVEQVVEQLSLTRVLNPLNGSTQEKPGPFVEPVYLQVVCQMLWTQPRPCLNRITASDLMACRPGGVEGGDGVSAALQVYYERTVERVARESQSKGHREASERANLAWDLSFGSYERRHTEVSERAIRNWFERALISERDLRLPMLLGEEKKYGLEPRILVDLANAYLIRSDRRSGGVWYELAHDRLVAPIRKSNRAWRREKLSPFQQAADVWNESGRKADLLVGGEVLAEGERLPGDPAGLWSNTDAEFLDACRAERGRKEAEATHSLKQARLRWWITCISVVGLILVIVLAIWSEVLRRSAYQAREETERILVAEFWRPIGRQDDPLNGIEVSALTELGSLPKEHDRARVRFVEEALANAANSRRFARRAAAVIQAAVGLNRDLAERVREVSQRRLADEAAGFEVRAAAAQALAELPPGRADLLDKAAKLLLDALGREKDASARLQLALALGEIAKGLPPDEAAQLMRGAFDKEKDASARLQLALALGEMTKGLPKPQRADLPDKAAKLLLDALDREKDAFARSQLAAALGETAKGLPPDRAAQLLLDAFDKEKDGSARLQLALALGETAKGLPPDKAAQLLLDALGRAKDASARLQLALGEMAKGLPEAQRADRLDKAAKLLLDALKEKDAPPLSQLAAALGEMAQELPEPQRADLLDKAARFLLGAFDKEKAASARLQLALALGEMAKGLLPDKAAQLLLDALGKEKDASARSQLAAALEETAKGLPPDKAAQLLRDALGKEKDASARRQLEAAMLPLGAFAKVKDASSARSQLAAALEKMAEGLPEPQKADLLDKVARFSLGAFAKEKDASAGSQLAAWGETAKRLPPDKAAQLLRDALQEEDASVQSQLHTAWMARVEEMAKGLPPGKGAKLDRDASDKKKRWKALRAEALNKAGKLLLDALDKQQDTHSRKRLAEALAKVSTEAGVPKGTGLLFQALAQHPNVESSFLAALEPMATQMKLPEAVDLLKQPLCYGKARQVLLRRVEQLTGQTFPSCWDMVDYLRHHRPDIDLDTPPQRPDE